MNIMKTILIITNSFDLHADLIEPILKQKNQSFFRLNLDKFPKDYHLKQLYVSGKVEVTIEHLLSKQTIHFEDIGAVWNRKPAPFSFISNDLAPQELAFAKTETEHTLFGLLYTLDCYWMSHPVNLRGAMWKGEQLNRATQFGFRIPHSLVTNCPEDVRRFKSLISGDIIFKSLSTPDLASVEVDDDDCIATGLATTIVTDELMNNLEAVREIPCHFQEYIPKKYELRVTVVGNSVFVAKLYSQDDERTKVDSRDMSAEIRYEATALPDSIHKRCLEFVKSYGLNYSAMDIIVTPDEDYVFLENNPNGQFLYIQELIPEFNILETVADTLIKNFREDNEQYLRSAAY